MESESAKTEKPKLIKGKKIDTLDVNHDIRAFFTKSATPCPVAITTNKRLIKVIEPYLKDIEQNYHKLRERKIVNYKHKFEPSDDSASHSDLEENQLLTNGDNDEMEVEFTNPNKHSKKMNKKRKRGKDSKGVSSKSSNSKSSKSSKEKIKTQKEDDEYDSMSVDSKQELSDSEVEYIELLGLKSYTKLKIEAYKTINDADTEMKKLLKEFYINEQKISDSKSKYPNFCIPIAADIREFKFKQLAEKQSELTGQLFDVIMMDPPWQLSSSQPTRGVAIAYDTLNDNIITDIPVDKMQTDGFIFIWTINAKFKVTLDLLKQWGYK